MYKRHGIFFLTALILICGTMFFQSRIEHLLSRISRTIYAGRTLQHWGLQPSGDNIQLLLSADHNHPPCIPTTFNLDIAMPSMSNLFTKEYTYKDLFDDGYCRIGVCADNKTIKSLQPLASALSTNMTRRVSLHLMTAKNDFIHALNTNDIVLYFGHANLGRGIVFDDEPEGEYFRMGPEYIDIPTCYLVTNDAIIKAYSNGFCRIRGGSEDLQSININCKVFAYLGCRTDGYYRKVWKQNAPACCFIGTTYTCDTTSTATEFVHSLISGIYDGKTLNQIIERLNRNKAKDILFGRVEETRKYNNPTNHAAVLFTIDPI